MPFLRGHRVLRRILLPVITLIVALFGYSGSALAYGPPPPSVPPGVGAFGCVLTSRDVSSFGSTIGPLADGALVVTLHIGALRLRHPVDVTITEPYSPSGSCASDPASAGRGFHIVGGVGVVMGNASDLFLRFPGTVWLTITYPGQTRFERGEVVPLGDGGGDAGGIRTHGTVTIAVDNPSDWLYLVRNLRPDQGRGSGADAMHRERDPRLISAAVTVTSALLPHGMAAPGTGVVLAPDTGHALTAGGSSTTAR
jgi:hypothetical protein